MVTVVVVVHVGGAGEGGLADVLGGELQRSIFDAVLRSHSLLVLKHHIVGTVRQIGS